MNPGQIDSLEHLPRMLPNGRKPEPIKPHVEGAMDAQKLQDLVAARARDGPQRAAPADTSFKPIKDQAMDPQRLKAMMEDRARLAEPLPQPTRPPTALPKAARDAAIPADRMQQRIQQHRTFTPSGQGEFLFEGTAEGDIVGTEGEDGRARIY